MTDSQLLQHLIQRKNVVSARIAVLRPAQHDDNIYTATAATAEVGALLREDDWLLDLILRIKQGAP